MTSELMGSLSLAVGGVLVVALLCGAGLMAWRGWLQLKRLELQLGRHAVDAGPPPLETEDTGVLIELAAVKERLRRLEAIASGVEL